MEEESGITFGEICHLIKKRVWWILGIAVVVALVASLLFAFVINRGKNEYSLTFMVEFPGAETKTYPDGTPYNYASMIYADKLSAAKASDEKFAQINIDAMSANGITLTAETEQGANNTTVQTGVYTITVSSSYFVDAAQATEFLRALLGETIKDVNAKIAELDFTAELAGYDLLTGYSAYGDRLAALQRQQDALLKRYETILGISSENETQNNTASTATYGSFKYENKSISALYAEARAVSSALKDLQAQYRVGGFVHYSDGTPLEPIAQQWGKQIAANNKELEDLQKAFPSGDGSNQSYVEIINAIVQENILLRAQIGAIGYKIDSETTGTVSYSSEPIDNKEFGDKVDAMRTTIKNNSETAQKAFIALFGEESRIAYQSNGVKVIDNTTNVILIAVVAFVVVFLLASIIFCAVDYPAYKRAREEKKVGANAAQAEVPAQKDE